MVLLINPRVVPLPVRGTKAPEGCSESWLFHDYHVRPLFRAELRQSPNERHALAGCSSQEEDVPMVSRGLRYKSTTYLVKERRHGDHAL